MPNYIENSPFKIFVAFAKYAAKMFGYDAKYIIKAHSARINEPKVFCDSSHLKIKS